MNLAASFCDRQGDVADETVEEPQIAEFAKPLGDRRRGAHVDEEERALLDPGVVVAPGGESEQDAGA